MKVLLVLCLVYLAEAQLVWEQIALPNTSAVPSVRQDSSLAHDGTRGQLVMFGGRTELNRATVILGDTWVFNLQTSQWRDVRPSVSPSPRYSFVSGLSGDYFYVATGHGPSGLFLNDIWRFHLVSETWEELPAQTMPPYLSEQQWGFQSQDALKPSYRYGAGGGIYPNGSNFYVSLGTSSRRYADTFSYNTKSLGWFRDYKDGNPYNPSYPHARCLHAATMMSDEELIIYGGCLTGGESGGPCPSGDAWVFNGQLKTWRQLPTCAAPKMRATLAMLPTVDGQRRALLYGGVEESPQVVVTVDSPSNQVGIYNPDTEAWTLRLTQGAVPPKMASVSMATGEDGIYMFGGKVLETDELSNSLYHLRGTAVSADHASVQAQCSPTFFSLILLHGILMAAGFGFFLLWGPFVARYCKHKRFWFSLHVTFQVFGFLLVSGGLICACLSVQFDHFRFVHAYVGIVAVGLVLLQPLNAFFRPHQPGNGEAKTLRRLLWEMAHRFIGRIAVCLGLVNISLGVFFGLASEIVWGVWYAYLALAVLIYCLAEANHKFKGNTYGEKYITHKYNLRNGNRGLIMEDKNGIDNVTLEGSEG